MASPIILGTSIAKIIASLNNVTAPKLAAAPTTVAQQNKIL